MLVTGSQGRNESGSLSRCWELILVKKGDDTPIPAVEERSPLRPPTQTTPVRDRGLLSPDSCNEMTPGGLTNSSSVDFSSQELGQVDWGFTQQEEREGPSESISETPHRSSAAGSVKKQGEVEKIRQVVKDVLMSRSSLATSPSVQVVDLGKNEKLLALNHQGVSRAIPCRALDAVFVGGDLELGRQYREEAFRQLFEMKAKERKDFATRFVDPSQKELDECLKGKGKDQVDVEKGRLYFEAESPVAKKHPSSTKYPFLRPVQYFVMDVFLHHVHANQNHPRYSGEEGAKILANEFPYCIEERIRWMYQQKMFETANDQSVDAMCQAYRQALLWYENSQRAYERSGQSVVDVSCNELITVGRTIQDFIRENPPKPIPSATPVKAARSSSRLTGTPK